MIHYTFKRETRVERKIFILSRSIHFYSDIGGSRTIVLRQVGAARAGEKETQRRRAPVAYWCDSPNPARAPTVEHVCNTTRRAPASGEERNTRDSIPLARSTRHSPLNSRRSAAVVSLSLSVSLPKTRSFLCLEQGGSGSGVPNAYARTPSSNQQAIRHFAAWNAFSFRKPARTGRPLAPACTDTRDRAAVNGWRLIDSCAWEGAHRGEQQYPFVYD